MRAFHATTVILNMGDHGVVCRFARSHKRWLPEAFRHTHHSPMRHFALLPDTAKEVLPAAVCSAPFRDVHEPAGNDAF
jgi:hypothetical protein